jgi:flagellar protein FlaG
MLQEAIRQLTPQPGSYMLHVFSLIYYKKNIIFRYTFYKNVVGGIRMSSSDLIVNQSYVMPNIERIPMVEHSEPAKQTTLLKSQSVSSTSSMKSYGELKRAEGNGEIVTISDEQLVKAIQKAIKAAEGITTSLEFSVHKETHQISVKVLDKETGEIIREIPPEKNLDFLATLWRKAGILIDEKR